MLEFKTPALKPKSLAGEVTKIVLLESPRFRGSYEASLGSLKYLSLA